MFKVLSLDGGGIKGAFTAAVLSEFEEKIGKDCRLADCFDLIVGSSTGGILALGLAQRRPAKDIEELYRRNASKIFPQGNRSFSAWFQTWFGPKYELNDLKSVIEQTFGDARFGSIPGRVAITAFSALDAHPRVFKSPGLYHDPQAHQMTLVDIALSTAAAPTYFKGHQSAGQIFLDGGIWANCPVMVGIAEAIHTCERRPDTVHVLSVGTTSEPLSLNREITEGGKIEWASESVTLFMRAMKLGTLDLAKKLCGRLVRLDEQVKPNQFDLDSADFVGDIISLGHNCAKRAWDQKDLDVADFFRDRNV